MVVQEHGVVPGDGPSLLLAWLDQGLPGDEEAHLSKCLVVLPETPRTRVLCTSKWISPLMGSCVVTLLGGGDRQEVETRQSEQVTLGMPF